MRNTRGFDDRGPIIAPDLILEEIEVQHVRDVPQKPIVVPPPAVAAK